MLTENEIFVLMNLLKAAIAWAEVLQNDEQKQKLKKLYDKLNRMDS